MHMPRLCVFAGLTCHVVAAGSDVDSGIAIPFQTPHQARQLSAGVNYWPTDHGDNYNSGNVAGQTAASSAGFCRSPWVPYGVAAGPAFWMSGVGTTAASNLNGVIVGDSAGVVHFLTDTGLASPETALVTPATVFGTTSLSGQAGFYGTGVSVFNVDGSGADTVILPSLDGYVYALSHSACAESGTPTGSCGVWKYESPIGGLFPASPKYSASLGVVFVPDASSDMRSAANVRALNASTGAETVWTSPFPLVYNGSEFPMAGGMTVAFNPLSPNGDTQLLVPVGPTLQLVDAATGLVLPGGMIDTNTLPGAGSVTCATDAGQSVDDMFASAPVAVLREDSTVDIFLHALSGNIWSLKLTQAPNVSFTCNWVKACSIPGPGQPAVCTQPTGPSLHEEALHGAQHAGLGEVWTVDTMSRSTPAVDRSGFNLAVTTPALALGGNNPLGVLILNTESGALVASWNSAGTDANQSPLPYRGSRSSPVYDAQGNLYFTADFDFNAVSGNPGWANDTVPALVALAEATGSAPSLRWAYDLGPEFGGSVGIAGPLVMDGLTPGTHRVLAAGTLGSYHAATGCPVKCGSSNPLLECSGHGSCNGGSGNCSCVDAWNKAGDPTCQSYAGCGRGGFPQPDGSCVCEACWQRTATGQCNTRLDCLNGGYCEVVNKSATCLCPTCNSADPVTGLCTVPYLGCGPAGIGCDIDTCLCGPCSVASEDGLTCLPRDCGNGFCDTSVDGNGTCTCDACWQQDANTGSCSVGLDCGAGGTCIAENGGTCENNGDQCWLYDRNNGKYDTYQDCNKHGTCNDATGHCQCNTGWSNFSIPKPCSACDACHSGQGLCNILNTCSGNGVCLVVGPAQHTCLCSEGWAGTSCEAQVQAAPAGVDPAVGAGVGITFALLGAAGIGFFMYRRRGAGYSLLSAEAAGGSGGGAGLGSTGGFQASAAPATKGKAAGAAAPKSFASISRSAGFDSEGAKAAVSRLGGAMTGGGKTGGSGASDSTGLLSAARTQVKVPKGSYGGL